MYVYRMKQIPPWKLALFGAAGIAIAGVGLFLGGLLLLVLAPIALGAFALNRVFGPKRAAPRRQDGPIIIEGRYEEIEPRR